MHSKLQQLIDDSYADIEILKAMLKDGICATNTKAILYQAIANNRLVIAELLKNVK